MSMTLEEIQKRIASGKGLSPTTAAPTGGTTTAAEDLKAFSNYVPVRFGPDRPAEAPTADTASPTTAKRKKGASSGAIDLPILPVANAHTIVPMVNPATYEWTGTDEDQKIIDRVRKRYKWEKPAPGTQMYGGYFGGINGTAPGLGARNDNPIDINQPGAGFVSQGIDPNDPALGYFIERFKKNQPCDKKGRECFAWAEGEYWKNNKKTGNKLADDAAVLDWYWRDLARRMDKSNGFFDSFIGKLITSVAIGWATAGIGAVAGPWAAAIFGGVAAGATSDWDPLSMVLGAAGPFTGNILDATGISGLAKSIMPEFVTSFIPDVGFDFSYGIDDALKSVGWTTAKAGLEKFQKSRSPTEQLNKVENPLQPGTAPGLTPGPASYNPTPITPIPPVMFEEEEEETSANPFDVENNPFNPVTEYAQGGAVKKRMEDMTDNEFIGMRRDDMPGSARKDLEALMAQIGQYAAGGMVPEYGYGGMVPEYGYGGMVPEYADGGMVPEYAEGGEVEGYAAGGQVPSYLGDEYNFAGSTIPGFYQLNAEQFPFWAMRNQQDGSVFTPGRPQFTPYNMNSPEVQGGVRMPNGRFLYAINQDTSTGYPRDPLAQEFLRRSYGPSSVPDKVVQKPKASDYNRKTRKEYNQAMQEYAKYREEIGSPLMVYYDPKFSRKRGRKRTSPLLASQEIV